MKITKVRTKLCQWKGPVKTDDTIFATPVSLLPDEGLTGILRL